MTDDLLARAARALRDETEGDDAGARFTRSRIMASVHEDRVKRRTRLAFLLPIAATFIAASAFGAAGGGAHRAIEAVARALGIHSAPAPAARPAARAPIPSRSAASPLPVASTVAAPEPAAPGVVAPEPEPSATVAAAPLVESPRPAPRAMSAERLSALAPPATSAAADPSFELYKAAHEAHFVERDYGRALAAWDAYLRAAPRGALAPEARYNRAICLVRLHRSDEARAALVPFAEGRFGTYRRAEAKKLLEALPPELRAP
jgi:TolA-binding protein